MFFIFIYILCFLFQVNDEPRPAIHEEKNETERGKNCFYSCNWSNCECVFYSNKMEK